MRKILRMSFPYASIESRIQSYRVTLIDLEFFLVLSILKLVANCGLHIPLPGVVLVTLNTDFLSFVGDSYAKGTAMVGLTFTI
jgi:hypothetical protein